jgi:hypothetical protein
MNTLTAVSLSVIIQHSAHAGIHPGGERNDNQAISVIDLAATGKTLPACAGQGITVREMQAYFGFEEPQAIYKWQRGKSLPTVDNLYALSNLLEVPMNEILVSAAPKSNIVIFEQQAESCCSVYITVTGCFRYGGGPSPLRHLPLPPETPSVRGPSAVPGARRAGTPKTGSLNRSVRTAERRSALLLYGDVSLCFRRTEGKDGLGGARQREARRGITGIAVRL